MLLNILMLQMGPLTKDPDARSPRAEQLLPEAKPKLLPAPASQGKV